MEPSRETEIHQFVLLPVASITSIGAFLKWNDEKDLLLPFSEQTDELQVGDDVIVYIFLDSKERPIASMKLEKFVKSSSTDDYKLDRSVELLITHKTDLGYKALINGRHWGVLYENEVFKSLHYGQQLPGFIKKVREDGKIDLKLQASGHRAAVDDIGPQIIEALDKNGGFLNLTDKTSPEKIYELFGVSKKKFKIALGALYKKRLITISDDGIKLVDN